MLFEPQQLKPRLITETKKQKKKNSGAAQEITPWEVCLTVTVTFVTTRGCKVGFKESSSLSQRGRVEEGPACSWTGLGAASRCQHHHRSEMADTGGGQEYLHTRPLLPRAVQALVRMFICVNCPKSSLNLKLVLFHRGYTE